MGLQIHLGMIIFLQVECICRCYYLIMWDWEKCMWGLKIIFQQAISLIINTVTEVSETFTVKYLEHSCKDKLNETLENKNNFHKIQPAILTKLMQREFIYLRIIFYWY